MITKEGVYHIKIQFITHETQIIRDLKLNDVNPKIDLGKVYLSSAEKQLDEVVVQAERTQMEMSLEKKIYNVGKDISNQGGSATDLLDNLPSVTVDMEGNVELRGSSNVEILIDGKPSGLVGLSSNDALSQIQSNMIEKVEVITNPSARYDAEGQSGIINLVMKKEKSKGINGSFQLASGYPHNHGVSANMNFRKKWINLFLNYGVNYRDYPGGRFGRQEYLADIVYTDTTSKYTDLRRPHQRSFVGQNIQFGTDFFLNDKNQLTLSYLYRYSDEYNETRANYYDRNISNELIQYTLREDDEKEGDKNAQMAINYIKTFDKKDQKFTIDIQYQDNTETEDSDIIQYVGESEETDSVQLFQQVLNQESEQRLMIQSDYVHPFSDKGKFEIGSRSTFRDIDNSFAVDEKEKLEDDFVKLEDFSTDFKYLETVHSFYAMVSNEMGRVSWQLGLRSETTDIVTKVGNDGENENWHYTNLFPSSFFTYKISETDDVQISYSRRIRRPRFRDLNAFSSFSDNRNLRTGNPELQPEFTNSYEIGIIGYFTSK